PRSDRGALRAVGGRAVGHVVVRGALAERAAFGGRVVAEAGRVRVEIDRLAGDQLDPYKLRHVLADFDTLFAVASPTHPTELLQLLISRIVVRGHDADVTLELFAGVNLPVGGSKSHTLWLRRRASNP